MSDEELCAPVEGCRRPLGLRKQEPSRREFLSTVANAAASSFVVGGAVAGPVAPSALASKTDEVGAGKNGHSRALRCLDVRVSAARVGLSNCLY